MKHSQPLQYEIRVKGHLGASHRAWLENLSVRLDFDYDQPITILSGPLPDQSALYGVLFKLQNMGVTLLELRRQTF